MALQNKTDTVLVYTRATAKTTAKKAAAKKAEKKVKSLYNEEIILPVNEGFTTIAKRNAKLGSAPKVVATENKLFDFKTNQAKAKK